MRGRKPARQDRLEPELAPAVELAVERDNEVAGKGVAVGSRPDALEVARGAAGDLGRPGEIDADADHSRVPGTLEQNARELGADRGANSIAAHAKYPGDVIVIDFGTATTFDVVDFNGAYKGGIIAPGINLSLDALVNNTAKLPRIAIEAPRDKTVTGRNTEDQMLIGVFWGYVAMMEGLIARLKAEIGRPAKVVATGGLALLFDKHTEIFDAVDTDLTLNGLAILAERAAAR